MKHNKHDKERTVRKQKEAIAVPKHHKTIKKGPMINKAK
jgi:hypothetical protein